MKQREGKVDLDTQEINSLFLDTTLPYFSIGIKYNGKIYEDHYPLMTSHSIDLEKRIFSFLDQYELTLNDFDEYIYNPGPGSFTGVRIGAAFLNGFAVVSEKTISYIPLLNVVRNTFLIAKQKSLKSRDVTFECSEKVRPDTIYIRNAKKQEFYGLKKNSQNFFIVKLNKLKKEYPNWNILYDGTMEYEDFPYKKVFLYPRYFLKNMASKKNIENFKMNFFYINQPDIR
jgi:tRNA A37 threonylcarbamoyladenosine modification protein TsaB